MKELLEGVYEGIFTELSELTCLYRVVQCTATALARPLGEVERRVRTDGANQLQQSDSHFGSEWHGQDG